MSSHVARLGLGVLAALTLFLSAGGALGLWHTGAPATGSEVTTASGPSTASGTSAASAGRQGALRPAAARWQTRDAEGSNGDIVRSTPSPPTAAPDSSAETEPSVTPQPPTAPEPSAAQGSSHAQQSARPRQAAVADVPLPARSGSGRRVVFDMSAQRVWIVGRADQVLRTYPVSGSVHDNLDPGHYEVYSRSRHAVSYNYEETMRYMVRFATGDSAAIGFHDIPRDQQGDRVQTRAQLGRPMSSGCIRQARPDAIALWRFADVGTPVVVTR